VAGDDAISDAELVAMQQRVEATAEGPWTAHIAGPGDAFDTVITVGGDACERDIYVYRDKAVADDADFIFIAAAWQDVPRLMAEVRRLRRELDRATGGA
jgi:hypothetical protein